MHDRRSLIQIITPASPLHLCELQEKQKDEVPAAGGNAVEADAVLDAAGEEDDDDEDVDMDEVLPLVVVQSTECCSSRHLRTAWPSITCPAILSRAAMS